MTDWNRGISDYRSVTLDANGYGYVQWIPQLSTWVIKTVAVTGNSTAQPVARNYIGFIGRPYYQDATSTGNGDMSDTMYEIKDGTSFYVEWSGGTAGAIMTATITYDATVPSPYGFRTR